MRTRASLLVLLSAWLALPVAASACDTYLAYVFMRAPSGPYALGAGIQMQPGEDGGPTYWIPNVEAAFGLGERVVVKPAIGLCFTTGGPDGFSSESEVTLGGGAAVRVFDNASVSVNLQAAVTHVSYGDASEQVFPITGAAQFAAGDAASIFAGGGIQFSKDSFFPDSEVDGDPVLFGGVSFGTGIDILVGLMLKFGEDGLGGSATDVALNASFGLPIG